MTSSTFKQHLSSRVSKTVSTTRTIQSSYPYARGRVQISTSREPTCIKVKDETTERDSHWTPRSTA